MLGHPIPPETIESIDILATKKNGDIILRIISSGYLDNSEQTIEILLKKINNYLDFINSQEFEQEFGYPSLGQTKIFLNCSQEPHLEILGLIESIQEQVNSYNASIFVEIR